MSDSRRRELEARELRLLQERTEVQHQIERLLDATNGWDRAANATLERQRQRIHDELATVRAELNALLRSN